MRLPCYRTTIKYIIQANLNFEPEILNGRQYFRIDSQTQQATLVNQFSF